MAKQPIVKSPNSVLKKVAREIPAEEISSRRVQRLISDMKETLAAAPDGVGLAAPQVGESFRLFLISEEARAIDRGGERDGSGEKKNWKSFVFINPVFTKRSRKRHDMAEGCLSVPGTFGIVPRSEKVFLEWLDENGNRHARGFTKFFARVIQHEMDHLDGTLITAAATKVLRPSDKS